jgi:hypothetical protein
MQPITIPPDASRSDVLPAKFAYASGSRPLDGYTIKRGVGSGGFGEVYYATSDGGKDVALKLIRRNLDIELRGVQQCLNLKHPNLLGLFDVRVDAQGNSWVVMEYVAGDCLEDVLNAHPNGLPLGEALDWFRGVAAAVAYLHDHGIVHRDLKPGNIFRDQGVVKLGDYGLSKFISVSRRSGQTESIGTVHYMAPEIANGRYGKEIDLYALGILLYELLTGHVPFEGESVGEVLMKHLTAEPDVSRLAEPYRSLVRDCLAKDPTARPRSAAELLARLEPGARGTESPAAAAPWNKPAASPRDPNFGQPVDSPPASVAFSVGRTCSEIGNTWHDLPLLVRLLVMYLLLYFVFVTLGVSPAILVAAVFVTYAIMRKKPRRRDRRWLPTFAAPAAPLPPRPASPNVAAPAAPMPAKPLPVMPLRSSLRVRVARAALVLRSPRERWAELLSSLLFAPLVAAVLIALVTIFRGEPVQSSLLAWQWSVAALASWLVLIPAKLWEGYSGDQWRRRFVMLLAGLALGAFAWWLDDFLFIDLHYGQQILSRNEIASEFHAIFYGNRNLQAAYAADGQPLLMGYLRYFALLMAVPRWWLQADPLRKRRVNVLSVGLTILIALVLASVTPFPQPWAMIVAGTAALSVQLAGPWQDPKGVRHGAA